MYTTENNGVRLYSVVRIKPGCSEWFDMIRKKFTGDTVGFVTCIGRWSGKIQVEFQGRTVNGLQPDDLEVVSK